MLINTDDYNKINEHEFLEYYLEDSLFLRIGRNKPKYYIKKESVPKLDQIFEVELNLLREMITSNLSKQKIEEQANKIKELKKKFPDLPCKSLDEFITSWRI